MTKSKSVFARSLVVVAVLALSLTAVAQIQNGQITGTVLDQQGAAISGATVKVSNPATNVTVTATTSDTGMFLVRELPPAAYKITVEKQGFKTASQASFTVNVGVVHRVDFKLTVGERTEVVEVMGTAPLVNTEDSKLSSTVGSQQILSLPLNGRNVYDLIKFSPGAVDASAAIFENGAGAVVNGLRMNFNGFLVNGVSNRGLSGGTVNIPVEDTVQEFQELTLNMSAQYGNAAGATTNLITKSGTNAWHGGVWWFLRNDALDANAFFNNQAGAARPELRYNQFGGTLGGPIVKDKLFFFASYQGDRFFTSSLPTQTFVESPEWRTAVALANSTYGTSPIAALLYNDFRPADQGRPDSSLNDWLGPDFAFWLCPDTYAGLPGDPTGSLHAQAVANLIGVIPANDDFAGFGCSVTPGAFVGTFNRDSMFVYDSVSKFPQQISANNNQFNGTEASLRLDWNARANDRLFAEFKWLKYKDPFGPGLAASARGFTNPITNVFPHFSFNWVHTFSPRVLNEFRAGYLGNISLLGTSIPGVPSIYIESGELGFGSYNGYPQFFKENIYTYSDMLSISHGKHSLKIGYDLRRNIENSEFDVARPSYYFLDSLFFAIDTPYFMAAGVQPCVSAPFTPCTPHLETNDRHWSNWEHGIYFQDDWKVSRRLTLNLGIRYDLYQRHTEQNDLATTFIKGPGTNVVDDITTGAGWLQNANQPAGTGTCIGGLIPTAQLAGVCGPGGFAAAKSLGKGDHNNFGPRVGFAWDVFGSGKTSLRGGFGVSYEGTLYNPLSNSRWNLPYYSFNEAANFLGGGAANVLYGPQSGACALSYTGDPCPANNQGAAGTPSGVGTILAWDATNPNKATLTGIILPEGIRDPYVYNYFLGIQHELFSKTVLEVNYVGTTAHKLFRSEDINRIPGGTLPLGTCVTDSLGRNVCGRVSATNPDGRINPNYGRLRNWLNNVNSNYNALQVSLRMQQTHGWTLNFNYTWSHSIDNGSTWHSGATSSNGRAGGEGFTTDQLNPSLDRGNSVFDIRHRAVINYIWEMPFFKGKGGFAEKVFGGWQLNGIWSFQSGAHWQPFCRSLSCDFDHNDLVTYVGNRPDSLADNVNATHDMWANGWGSTYALGAVGSGAFFSRPCTSAEVCYGNEGRNTFVGPGFWGADMSLFKTIKVTEKVNLQFRAEGFNVFNHTNFQMPVNRLERPNFGRAVGTFNPRQLQFGLKLNF